MSLHTSTSYSSTSFLILVLLLLTLVAELGSTSLLARHERNSDLRRETETRNRKSHHHNKHNTDDYMQNSVHQDKRLRKKSMRVVTPEEEVKCHQAALWKCGHVFMKMYKMLNNLSEDDAFEPKCALRSTFFSCLKSLRSKPCKNQRKVHERFRKKLADTLWATRNCLVGLH